MLFSSIGISGNVSKQSRNQIFKYQTTTTKKKYFKALRICEIHFRETKWDEIGFRFYLRQSQWTYGGSLAVSIIVAAYCLPSFFVVLIRWFKKMKKRIEKDDHKIGEKGRIKMFEFHINLPKIKDTKDC